MWWAAKPPTTPPSTKGDVEVIQGYQDLMYLLETGQLTIFLYYLLMVAMIMWTRRLGGLVFYVSHRLGVTQQYPKRRFKVTAIVTVIDEDEEGFRECIKKLHHALVGGTTTHSLIVIVDGMRRENPDAYADGERLAQIAFEEGADLVLGTDAGDKRTNLRNMVRLARQRGILHEILCFGDADTVLASEDVIECLARPFSDARIGGTTTVQRIHAPATFAQMCSDQLEHSRVLSSMPFASIFGQVLCMPGRLYMVRTSIVEHRINELANQWFKFLWIKVRAKAGDDRVITNFVLQAGYKTIMVPDARVLTTAPETFRQTFKMWLRWGRSSQWYTILSWRWLWRHPVAYFIGLTDLLITLGTVFIVSRWPFVALFGDGRVPLIEALLTAFCGMMLTMLLGQMPHYWWHPKRLLLLPLFVVIVTIGQFIRFYALLTPHKIGTWGTRAGADETRQTKAEVWTMFERTRGDLP